MARLFTLLILLAAVLWALYALRGGRGSLRRSFRDLLDAAHESGRRLMRPGTARAKDLLDSLRVVLYFLTALSVVILATTGFIPYWVWGRPSSGFSLLLHVAVAPVFAVSMTGLVLLWAHRQQLEAYKLEQKLIFWALVLLSSMVLGSIMMGMYPIFATPGQQALLSLHLIAGLLFVVLAIVQIVLHVRTSIE